MSIRSPYHPPKPPVKPGHFDSTKVSAINCRHSPSVEKKDQERRMHPRPETPDAPSCGCREPCVGWGVGLGSGPRLQCRRCSELLSRRLFVRLPAARDERETAGDAAEHLPPSPNPPPCKPHPHKPGAAMRGDMHSRGLVMVPRGALTGDAARGGPAGGVGWMRRSEWGLGWLKEAAAPSRSEGVAGPGTGTGAAKPAADEVAWLSCHRTCTGGGPTPRIWTRHATSIRQGNWFSLGISLTMCHSVISAAAATTTQ